MRAMRHRGIYTTGLALLMATVAGNASAAGSLAALVGSDPVLHRTVETSATQTINTRYFHRRVSPERMKAVRADALRQILETKLLALAARDRGLELPLARARVAREAMERRIGKEKYLQSISALGWDRDDHIQALAENILAGYAKRCFIEEEAAVSRAEAESYYRSHRDAFREPPSQHLEHMLIGLAPTASEAERQAAKERGLKIVAELRRGGSFQDQAFKYSTVASRVKGGDIGFVHKGQLQEPIESRSWTARLGEVAGPLESTDGFHIVRVIERRKARQLEFREVATKIRRQLTEKRTAEVRETLLREAARRHPVVILDPELQSAAKGLPGND